MCQREDGIFFAQRLRSRPEGNQNDRQARIITSTRITHVPTRWGPLLSALEVAVPGGIAPDSPPVVTTLRSVHTVTKQTRDDQTERLALGQTPLGGEVPTLRFCLGILFSPGDALDAGPDQYIQCLDRNEDGKQRHQGDAANAPNDPPHWRPFTHEGRIKDEGSENDTENCAYVSAFRNPQPQCQAGKCELEPGPTRRLDVQSRQRKIIAGKADDLWTYAPTGGREKR